MNTPSLYRMTQRTSRLDRCVLALTACVWLLQLPIPMFHHHESIDSGLVLAEHIERHHDVSTGSTYDWHWHLVLPSELCHGDGDSDAVPSTVVTAATTSGLSGCSSVTFGELDDVRRIDLSVFECVDPELGSLPEPMFVGACTHHLKPTVHTCALLCVMLC